MTSLNIYSPDVRPASDHSVLVTFGDTISREIHSQVRRAFNVLQSQSIVGVTNFHPSYSSLLISFNPTVVKAKRIVEIVRSVLASNEAPPLPAEYVVEIPVCYDEEFAPDMLDVASLHNLRPADVVRKHSGVDYMVYFLGFSPGFPYLGDLPNELTTPRLSTPRIRVPAGSIAIGGNQTGIYPIDSPGGWRIIGRTPRTLFFPEKNPPTLLHMGAIVRFVPITKNEYRRILREEKR